MFTASHIQFISGFMKWVIAEQQKHVQIIFLDG
jgi:hypothetical protein